MTENLIIDATLVDLIGFVIISTANRSGIWPGALCHFTTLFSAI